MAGNTIVFEKLILQGFGPYREPTTFTFSQGINGYIAANETGKTSMMAGLVAAIFGLSHRQRSVSAFNLDRFRNWNQPLACRGSLVLAAKGKRYQIQRDFDTHQAALWQLEDETNQRKLLVEGQHNPEARKPLKRYEEAVQSILGLSSRELFEATFFVAQPLPEIDQLSTELQGLLAGGKGASFQEALAWLLSDLKNLTKYTGPNYRGVTGRNMGKEGALEQITETIQTLKDQIAAGQQAADTLLEVQLLVGTMEEELKKARKELDQKNNTRQAWSGWQLLASQYAAAAKERGKLQKALEDLAKLSAERQRLETVLKSQYPEFENAPPELRAGLEKLCYLSQENRKTSETIGKLTASQDQGLRRQQELTSAMTEYQDWARLGADPAEKIKGTRRSAAVCLKTWETFQADRKKLQATNRQLAETYRLLGEATAEELDSIKNSKQLQLAFAAETEKARQSYQAAAQKIRDWQERQREHQSKFGDLLDLPAQAAAAAAEKWQLLQKQRELEQQLQDMGAPPKTPLGLRAAGGVILAGAALLLLGTGNPAFLIMGLSLAFLIGAFAVGLLYGTVKAAANNQRQAAQRDLAAVKGQMASYEQQLGPFSQANDMELARLVERLKNFEEEDCRLQALRGEMALITLPVLEKELQEKQEAAATFQMAIKKFTDAYVDVQEAYEDWKDLTKEQSRLASAAAQFAEATFGCEAARAEEAEIDSAALDDQWRELAAALQSLLGQEPVNNIANLGALLDQLAELKDSWWQEREDKAHELVKLRAEQANLTHQLETIEQWLAEETAKKTQFLTEQLKWEEDLAKVLQPNEKSPEKALQKYKERQQQVRVKEDTNTKLETLLSNYQVENEEKLKSKYMLAKDQAAGRMLKWQEHIEKYPGLPEAEHADDPGFIQQKMEEMDTAIQAAGDKISQLESDRSEFYRQLSRLEGVNPINIAAAEIELQELNTERTRLEQQADALTLAYQELGAAITDYSQTYQQRLQEKATAYFREISGVRARRIVLDDQLNLGIMEGGRPVTADSLSKGARDQMYLSLRFAVADLIAEDVKLPLIFDDPFTGTDAVRLERIRKILQEQASERQFFILAHAEHYQSWGKTIAIS